MGLLGVRWVAYLAFAVNGSREGAAFGAGGFRGGARRLPRLCSCSVRPSVRPRCYSHAGPHGAGAAYPLAVWCCRLPGPVRPYALHCILRCVSALATSLELWGGISIDVAGEGRRIRRDISVRIGAQ